MRHLNKMEYPSLFREECFPLERGLRGGSEEAQRKLFLHRAMETNTPIIYQEELSCIQRVCSIGQVLGVEG